MKIELEDVFVNDIILDLCAEIVKREMKDIILNEDEYLHKGDSEYYVELKRAARIVYNHYSIKPFEEPEGEDNV